MKIRIGPPATGANYYPRTILIKRIFRALEQSHLAFLGPRRTGKTSCLEDILANPPKGYLPIMLNLENYDNVTDWLTGMVSALRMTIKRPTPHTRWFVEKCGHFLTNIEEIQVLGNGIKRSKSGEKVQVWRKLAEDFLKLLKESNAPVLFLLDEFPTFLLLVAKNSSPEEAEAVLNWFRAARNELKDLAPRFLVTGSIGLKGVVRRLRLSTTINDFDTREIVPLEKEEAIDLLGLLAKGNNIPLDEAGCLQIIELLGANWPILLQLFVSEIQEADFKQPPTAAELEKIYHEQLIGGNRNEYCSGMFTRLAKAFNENEERLSRAILKALCRSKRGLTRDELEALHVRLVPDKTLRSLANGELDYVVDELKHDGYLLQEKGGEQRTRFASNILRDYWLRKTS